MSKIPKTAARTILATSIQTFLSEHRSLTLGGPDGFISERQHHSNVFGIQFLPSSKQSPIHKVEFTAVRGPHGTIPIRVLYPTSGEERRQRGEAAALVYFHGGGYTVGSVDEFENGLRLLAEESGVQIYAVEYRLAPEFKFPTQLDEYAHVLTELHGPFGASRGVNSSRIFGGGDSAGGNMTTALCLRLRDETTQGMEVKGMSGQVLLYPESRSMHLVTRIYA